MDIVGSNGGNTRGFRPNEMSVARLALLLAVTDIYLRVSSTVPQAVFAAFNGRNNLQPSQAFMPDKFASFTNSGYARTHNHRAFIQV